jgi:hypothetical protein
VSFLGYPDDGPIRKTRVKEFTQSSALLDKMPYTIRESSEPQKTLLYNIWSRCHNEKNNSFITTIGATGCVDGDTEFLTPKGWKKISDYEEGDLVMEFDMDTGKGGFTHPFEYIKLPADKFYSFTNKAGVSCCFSPEHTVVYYNVMSNRNYPRKISMSDLYHKHITSPSGFTGHFITSYLTGDGDFTDDSFSSGLSRDELILIVAIVCEGNITRLDDDNRIVHFDLTDRHKIELLITALNNLGIKYNLRKYDEARERLYFRYARASSEFDSCWYGFPADKLRLVAEHSYLWGSVTDAAFVTCSKPKADFIQFCYAATRRPAMIVSGGPNGPYHVVVAPKDTVFRMTEKSDFKTFIEVTEPKEAFKYCFSVYTGCLVLRKNNCVFITGNSGKSYTNIYFGYMLDVDKDGNHLLGPDNIIFDPEVFIDKAYNPDHVGQFLMKDEIEMDANSRRSFSAINQILGEVMSTVRYKRSIITFNLPTEQQLDIQVLRLRYGNIDCDRVAPDGTYSIFKWEYIESSKRREDSKYNPSIRRHRLYSFKPIENPLYGIVRSKVEYEYLKLYLPTSHAKFRFLLKDYDKRKDEYLRSKYDEFKTQLRNLKPADRDKIPEEDLIDRYLTAMDKNPEFFCPNKKKPSLARIQKEFKVPIAKARLIASEFKNTRLDLLEKPDKKVERSEFLDGLLKNKKSLLKGGK